MKQPMEKKTMKQMYLTANWHDIATGTDTVGAIQVIDVFEGVPVVSDTCRGIDPLGLLPDKGRGHVYIGHQATGNDKVMLDEEAPAAPQWGDTPEPVCVACHLFEDYAAASLLYVEYAVKSAVLHLRKPGWAKDREILWRDKPDLNLVSPPGDSAVLFRNMSALRKGYFYWDHVLSLTKGQVAQIKKDRAEVATRKAHEQAVARAREVFEAMIVIPPTSDGDKVAFKDAVKVLLQDANEKIDKAIKDHKMIARKYGLPDLSQFMGRDAG